MAAPSNPVPGVANPGPGWFARNWKWALLITGLGLVLLLAAFAAGILLLVETSFQHSGFYNDALDRARANPEVVQKIGQPLRAGWLASGGVNTTGSSSGDANVAIPISGPKGKGTIYLVAKKSAGMWKFETLQVEVAGQGERIDLLKSDEAPPQNR